MADKNFATLFKIIDKSMYYCGLHPNGKKDLKWMLTIFISYMIIGGCVVFLINAIVYYDIKNEDYAEATKHGIIALIGLVIIYRHGVLLINRGIVKQLLQRMDESITEAESYPPDEKEVVDKYIKMKLRIAKCWTVCVFLTGITFPLKSCILMTYYSYINDFRLIPLFDFTYPSFINKYKYQPLGFTFLYFLTAFFDFFTLCVYLSFDAFAPIILLHFSSELQILRIRINKAFADKDPESIQKQLRDINIKLQAINRYVTLTKHIFASVYEMIRKTITIMIPLAAFAAKEALQDKEISVEFIFFFVAALAAFFIPCYCSDHLLETSELLRETIYSCGWDMQPNIKVRKTILFMLTITTTPLVLETIFVPICLDTFAKVCSQSYTIYNLLNAVTT